MNADLLAALVLAALVCTAGCSGPQQPSAAPQAAGTPAPQAGAFALHIAGVAPGGTLPSRATCTGAFESPALSWENVPAGTRTLTLVMEDPDAPSGTYTHWIVYNIPPARQGIPAGTGAAKEIDGGGQQGTNSAGDRGYAAACPPIGTTHRYVFTLYAVDYTMGLPTADRESITTMLDGHWIGKATVTARFGR